MKLSQQIYPVVWFPEVQQIFWPISGWAEGDKILEISQDWIVSPNLVNKIASFVLKYTEDV